MNKYQEDYSRVSQKAIELLKKLDGYSYNEIDKVLENIKTLLYSGRYNSLPYTFNLDESFLKLKLENHLQKLSFS